MQFKFVIRYISFLLISSLLTGCGNESPVESSADSSALPVEGVVARVGDEAITFNELNLMLNSSAMVGLSIPALGTPERNQVIITLLDKMISANLLYLDAKKNGADRLVKYVDDMKKFEDAVLVTMYRSNVMIGDIPVSEDEINAFYEENINKETQLNDDVRLAIEAKIRKQRFAELKSSIRERLRADTEVRIFEDVLSVDVDDERSVNDTIATIGDKRVTWNDVAVLMRGADYHASLSTFYVDNDEERIKRLQEYIDNTLMADKAREAGMDNSQEFIERTAEYRKTHLINVYRSNLIAKWKPSEDELKTAFVENMDKISVPEKRKVQMVVVKTKQEAESIKADIDSGKITMFQAAQQYSIDPNAKRTLGEIGWVSQGSGFDELDDFTFSLEPEVVSEPVESPAGWHLVKVLDVTDALYQDFDDPQVQQLTLRLYMQNTFNDYVKDLRLNSFEVAVYEDELNRNFQKEADYIAELTAKAKQQDSVTEQRLQDLQKWITPPVE
jgi:peptidyl-prolyl cis-trans isomerase C